MAKAKDKAKDKAKAEAPEAKGPFRAPTTDLGKAAVALKSNEHAGNRSADALKDAHRSGELISVVFTKSWKRWYPGDRASFVASVAHAIVHGKVAEYADGALKRAASALVDKAKGLLAGTDDPDRTVPDPDAPMRAAHDRAEAAKELGDDE